MTVQELSALVDELNTLAKLRKELDRLPDCKVKQTIKSRIELMMNELQPEILDSNEDLGEEPRHRKLDTPGFDGHYLLYNGGARILLAFVGTELLYSKDVNTPLRRVPSLKNTSK